MKKNVMKRSIENLEIDVSEIIATCHINVKEFAIYNYEHFQKQLVKISLIT